MENKTGKYLKYAIGEIVLVVIGILIALQINTWNEERKTNMVRLGLLENLKEEFLYNKTELDRVMKLNQSNALSALEITKIVHPQEIIIDEEQCGRLIRKSLIAEVQYRPSSGALAEILSAGQLSIFESDQLKIALASWDGAMTKIRFQEQEHQNFRLKALDMVHEKGNMQRIYFEQFKGITELKNSHFENSNLELFKRIEFENLMSSFYMTAVFLNDPYYGDLLERIEEILMLIDTEISK